jgi:ankyrin repeat protein
MPRHTPTRKRATSSFDRLLRAVRAGDIRQVELLATGDAINLKGPGGITALLAAAAGEHYEVAKYLADHGADLTSHDENGARAIHAFAEHGWADLVERALDVGADPLQGESEASEPWTSAFSLAVRRGHGEVVRLLASRADWTDEQKGKHLGRALYHTTTAAVICALIECGADPNYQYGDKPVLFVAIDQGSPAVCSALASCGVDIEKRYRGGTAVYYAGMNDKSACMLALLDAGAEIESCGPANQGLSDVVAQQSVAGAAYTAWRARNVMRDVARPQFDQGPHHAT